MRIKPKKLRLILILVIAAGLAFYSYFQISKNINLRAKIREKDTILSELSSKVEDINSLKPQSEKIESDLRQLSLRFLEKEDPLPFILALEEIAEKQNISQEISIQEEETSAEEEKDPLASLDHLTFSINVSGSEANLISYLQELEKSNFLLDITSISLLSKEENIFKTNIILRVFTTPSSF